MAVSFKKKKENFKNYLSKLNCESKKKHNFFPKARLTQIQAMFEERVHEERVHEERDHEERIHEEKKAPVENHILFSDSMSGINKLVTEAKFYQKYGRDVHNGSSSFYNIARGTLENDRENIIEVINREKDKYGRVDTIMEMQKEFKELRQSKIAKGTGRAFT